MLNTEDFIKRMEFIMEHYGYSGSSFADKISVQRSSISHLLSGRNKPSLDFVMKILDIFPELNLYWLLDGTGSYLKHEAQKSTPNKVETDATPIYLNEKDEVQNSAEIPNNIEIKNQDWSSSPNLFSQKKEGKQLERIVLFYADGTFENYNPSGSK